MAFVLWRPALRYLALAAFWLFSLPALLWIYTLADFFVVRPRVFQTELFGAPIVSPWALRSARDECCIIPMGDGAMWFTFALSPDHARRLAKECRREELVGGTMLPVQPGTCLLRSKPFGEGGVDGGLRATLKGDMLEIEAVWM